MDRPTVKPPFRYFGGKTSMATEIADLLPPHKHYVEPFAGSLAVLLAKPPVDTETVNDLDGDLVNFWRVLRDFPDDLMAAAFATPHSRMEYETSRNLDILSDLERARRVWVRLTQGRSHSMKPTGWKYVKRNDQPGEELKRYAERMELAARRLSRVSLECRDALEIIKDYGTDPSVCIYADPPYLGSTRASNYRVEMLDDEAHVAFAAALNDCKASVVLSGYNAPLYADLFGDWHKVELKGATTLSGDTDRVEVLWSNVPIGEPDLFGGAA